ncbi:MAG: tRNA nucleotidyltransferase [Clostridia bacterium]|nr:tRNA nucleotidyltransferase [Clostridia bacterium]
MLDLPDEINYTLDRLYDSGYEAYLVGGAVRDMLMHKPAHDYDITTSAIPSEVERVFSSHRVVETGIRHGTVTVIVNGTPVEITSFRRESAYSDGRHPDSVTFSKDVRDDLCRRDLTINAVAYSKQKGYVDLFGGISDIENRIIRCVGSPDERFAEDHLRLLRAMRFSSVLGFTIEEQTKQSIHRNKKYIQTVSYERVFSELCKLLCGENAKQILLEYSDVIFLLIPELAVQHGCEREYGDGGYDLYTHTVNCISYTEPLLHLRLAALLHDTVKPSGANAADTVRIRDTVAANVLTRLRCSAALTDTVCRIIRYCDADINGIDKVGVKRFASKAGIKTAKDVIKLKRADILSEDPRYYSRLNDLNTALDVICEAEENGVALNVRDLAVNGGDIISLGVKRGPLVGELLRYALDGVISGEVCNERGPLLEFIAAHIKVK